MSPTYPSCQICRGACCEEFWLPVFGTHADQASVWLGYHGTRTPSPFGPVLRFECKCTKLTAEGQCSIYARRPQLCSDFIAGGPACLDVLSRRRTPEEQARIMGEE